jgi:hypothetical protein
MTTQNLRLKLSSPTLKLKSIPRYAAALLGGSAISVTSNGTGTLTVALNLLGLNPLGTFDPSAEFVLVTDINGVNSLVSVATLLSNAGTTLQVVTGAGDILIGTNTTLLVMNRTVDINPSNIILPLASTKIGRIKIVDFKGNASAFPHTIKTTAPDTFQGALTQWSLSGDGASIEANPISGTGYAV